MDKSLEKTYAFGAFIDVYGLMARFVNSKQDNLAKAMEARSKVFLSSSEEILIETFRAPLPLLFGKCPDGTSMVARSSNKSSMLPGLKTEQDWLSNDHSAGVKVCIEDQMDNVLEQVNNVILEQLSGADSQAVSLAVTMLAQSSSFLHELCNYVTLTLAELNTSGYEKADVWYLMSKILYRMFAIEFNKVRSAVSEGLDVDRKDELSSRKTLARRVLWGVLQTHIKMREFIKVGFKNHHTVSSEYVRFLIQKSNIGKVAKLENKVAVVESRVSEVEVAAREAKRKGETALNRADEAKKLCQKK